MLYVIFEDREGGCSCSPIDYKLFPMFKKEEINY
jgi:hypothetical protein